MRSCLCVVQVSSAFSGYSLGFGEYASEELIWLIMEKYREVLKNETLTEEQEMEGKNNYFAI